MSLPSIYTPELGDAILLRVAGGESLRSICSTPGMPHEATVRTWGVRDPAFGERLRQSREASAAHWDEMAERVLIEADATKEEIARARELAQHYRWRASKYAPRDYGDRMDLTVTGTIGIAAQLAEVRARRAALDVTPDLIALPLSILEEAPTDVA